MKKRSLGVVLTVAVVLVLSLAIVASASAAPYLTSCQPTNGSTATYGSYQLRIFGQNLTDFIGDPDVYLEQSAWPYDQVWATDVTVVGMMGGDYISCYINTYGETPGAYDVVVSGYTLLGQVIPQTYTLTGAFTVTGSNPVVQPQVASIRPQQATAGGTAFTLTVNGANFGTSPTVYWNANPLVTTPGGLPNPTATCTAIVPAQYIASAGTALISVVVGTQQSNYVQFTVIAAQPTLSSINPTTSWVNYRTPPVVTLTGSNFTSGSAQVLVNGVVHASTWVSASQMTVQLTAADIASAQTLQFSVRNGSSGTPTAALPFTVQAETTTPVTTISGADTLWHNQPVTLTINATDSQSGIWKTMFGIGASTPWTQLTGTTLTIPGPMGGDPNGSNVVSAYSIDNCNVQENPPVSVTVNICTTGPSTDAFAPAQVKKGKNLKLSYDAQSITPYCTFTLKIFKSNGTVAKSFNIGQKNSNKTYSYSFTCNLAPGKYSVKTFAVDAAGNQQADQTKDTFQVVK